LGVCPNVPVLFGLLGGEALGEPLLAGFEIPGVGRRVVLLA
jgi:hypothetical protein